MKLFRKIIAAGAIVTSSVIAAGPVGVAEAASWNCRTEINSPANTGARGNCDGTGIHRVWLRCGYGTRLGPKLYGAWQYNGNWSYINCSNPGSGETVRQRGVEIA